MSLIYIRGEALLEASYAYKKFPCPCLMNGAIIYYILTTFLNKSTPNIIERVPGQLILSSPVASAYMSNLSCQFDLKITGVVGENEGIICLLTPQTGGYCKGGNGYMID